MASEFKYRRRVQFAETDLAGIVHFSTMFRYLEEAEHAMWRAAGLTIAERGSEIGWPRLGAALEFRNPLRFEEEFEVWVRIAALKTRTLEYEFTIVRGQTVIAVGTMTSVCVRKHPNGTMRAAEIPAEIAERLQAVARAS
ncbi:MAG TPA: thioesterase family protein [Vicinamibacterales bacterium]|nr:thioesterase family protein [Vicinamibacterales bacterium]